MRLMYLDHRSNMSRNKTMTTMTHTGFTLNQMSHASLRAKQRQKEEGDTKHSFHRDDKIWTRSREKKNNFRESSSKLSQQGQKRHPTSSKDREKEQRQQGGFKGNRGGGFGPSDTSLSDDNDEERKKKIRDTDSEDDDGDDKFYRADREIPSNLSEKLRLQYEQFKSKVRQTVDKTSKQRNSSS